MISNSVGGDQLQVLVVGAGISGLVAARDLARAGCRVTVLEGRERVGGRAFSLPRDSGAALDLGPAWLWPAYQPRVSALLDELGLEMMPQFEEGLFLYEDAQGLREFEYPKRYADAVRVRGGIGAIATGLETSMPDLDLHLDSPVSSVEVSSGGVAVHCGNDRVFQADRLVLAIPPPLVAQLTFSQALDPALQPALTRWPTWMAGHAKLIAVYEAPFWREGGYSGSAVSQRGPLMEVVDHGDERRGLAALFGFVGLAADQRARLGPDALKRSCVDQLARLFGAPAASPEEVVLMDWSGEPFTAADGDRRGTQGHPPYGEPALREVWFDGRLALSSAEAASEHGGLVEGAILAGERAAQALITP